MRKQTVNILLRLDENEASYLERIVARSGCSRSAVLRNMIVNYQLCEKPEPAFYQSMKELARFGNNLNQLNAKANTLGFIDAPALQKEMQQWQKFRKDIYKKFLEPKRMNQDGSL